MLLTPFSSQATHQTATQSSIAIDWSSGSWRRGLPRTCLSWGGVKYRVSGPTWAMTTSEQWGTNGILIVLNTWNKHMMSSSLLLSVVKWGENHFKRWPKIHQDIDSNMAVEIPKNVVNSSGKRKPIIIEECSVLCGCDCTFIKELTCSSSSCFKSWLEQLIC